MTQEEKELLLVDLCARQPYRTYVLVDYVDEYNVQEVLNAYHIIGLKHYTGDDGLINIKPYLRQMSSMTREEEAYYRYYTSRIKDGILGSIGEYIDWLNKKSFDYHGLIPKGLALEAPKDMYKNI